MERNSGNGERPHITINRKMRAWNRYRVYIIGAGIVLITIIIMALIIKGCGSDKISDNIESKSTEQTSGQPETTGNENIQTKAENTNAEQTTPSNVVSNLSNAYALSGSAQIQEYNSKAVFDNAVFVGDFVVSGISAYSYLDDSKVFSDNNLTSDGLKKYTDNIVNAAPKQVLIMVGTNDLNYGTRTADDIFGYISTFVSDLQSKLPTANIYLVSILPVTSGFEASSNVKLTNINALNDKLKEGAASIKVSYIDIASAYKDNSGYFGTAYTDSGTNLKVGYYPFLLNGIAGVIK